MMYQPGGFTWFSVLRMILSDPHAIHELSLFNVAQELQTHMGHLLKPRLSGIAVTGGALLSQYISEKVIGYIGGTLFVVFSITTAAGIF